MRHSSPSTNLGIKHKYTSLVYVCEICQGVWIENLQVASLKHEQTAPSTARTVASHAVRAAQRVQCPSCHTMVGGLVDVGSDFPGLRVCSHCAAIMKYETVHVETGIRTR